MVHHLFPSIAQPYYAAVAPIVVATALEYNVKYEIVSSLLLPLPRPLLAESSSLLPLSFVEGYPSRCHRRSFRFASTSCYASSRPLDFQDRCFAFLCFVLPFSFSFSSRPISLLEVVGFRGIDCSPTFGSLFNFSRRSSSGLREEGDTIRIEKSLPPSCREGHRRSSFRGGGTHSNSTFDSGPFLVISKASIVDIVSNVDILPSRLILFVAA